MSERCPNCWLPMERLYAMRCWECRVCLKRLADDGRWMPSGTHEHWLSWYWGIPAEPSAKGDPE